jgi:hypothetical protein
VQIGPVFVGSAEKVSGGVFAIGHVIEKEAVAVGWVEEDERVVVGVGALLASLID